MSAPVPQHRRAIASRALSGDLRVAIEAAARAGFSGLEVWADDVASAFGSAAACRQHLADAGLRIASLQLLRDVEAVPDEDLPEAQAPALAIFDLADALDGPPVLVCSAMRADASEDRALSARQLARLADLAATRRLRLCFEGLSISRHIRSWRDAFDVVVAADRYNLGLCLDSAHMAIAADPLPGPAEIARIGFVQLADLARLDGDPIRLNRHERLFPGAGIVDCAALVGRLETLGYPGFYSLEVFSDRNRAGDPFAVARQGFASFDSVPHPADG